MQWQVFSPSKLCGALGWLLLSSIPLASADDRPNVLFVVADDLNCAIGPYGDPVAITPNLNRLSQRGVTFQRAYCQQAVCNPSRSSFLTGLRPENVGVDDLRAGFRQTAPNGESLVTLPQHFKNAGYFCQCIGKIFHNMGDQTHDPGSWSVPEVLHKGTHGEDTFFAANWSAKTKPPYKAPVTEAHDIAATVYRDGQIARQAAQMIATYDDSKPFFLAVGFWRPHLPFVAPKKYWDLYDPAAIDLPRNKTPPNGAPKIAVHSSREIKGYGLVPKDRAFRESEIRHYRHGYYASISFMDAQLGHVLAALRESSHARDTIVVFTSDHGFHIGQKGLWGKTSNFELDARVPLIIADPRIASTHGQSTSSLAELIDLYPTLADLTEVTDGLGENLRQHLDGVSLAPILRDTNRVVKTAAFTRHQQPFYGSSKNWQAWGHSVRTKRWRYTQWRSIETDQVIARELYDHANDADETQNVAGRAENADRVKRLASRLEQL